MSTEKRIRELEDIINALADMDELTPDDWADVSMLQMKAMEYVAKYAEPHVGACIELAKAYYRKPGNECGGPLHVLLDDDNIEDEHIAYCRKEAEARGDADGVEICDRMNRMHTRHRRVVVRAI